MHPPLPDPARPARARRASHLAPATRRRVERLAENVGAAFAVPIEVLLQAHRGSPPPSAPATS